eukprot:CAMPEP_0172526860 /NCGR_PEP_ID=MMETSP1067-20121228/1688_1 /TAXON_ID=265564 ORGANISM="Thalassiosira punctigera, Strain Tpunct2005C2" /NCGR_SAMPLE_ID=MMETSP1067 /ASSEMBLY_ACC=CAM_ASM_000444 /LENGTH=694 /DNA_ID=CAMNT_0013310471 /DNA_START=241 /DNA_END=2321 /DNA_ORIENTATION=-
MTNAERTVISTREAEWEDEMPSLTNSDTSRGDYDESPHGESSEHCEAGAADGGDDDDATRRRRRDRPPSSSSSRPASGADKSVSQSAASRGDKSLASRSIRPRSAPRSRGQSGPRSRSKPRSTSVARRREPGVAAGADAVPPPPRTPSRTARTSSRSRPRRPYHRCASMGGTTLYSSPHMATLDDYLRSTSGLRLQMDGTCNFMFEYQRFTVEMSDDGSEDFLFYSSFGSLKELQRQFRKRGNLLRLLAAWNEELKQRRGGDEEGTGLLRIDSSKDDGPHVAFIYYAQVGEMRDAMHFQETMDDFVDDALEFADKLNGAEDEGGQSRAESPQQYAEKQRAAAIFPPPPPPRPSPLGPRSGTDRQHSFSNDVTSFNEDSNSSNNSNHSHNSNENFINNQEETAPLAPPSPAITASDIYHATSKKSVFAKMINSIRSKSNAVDKNAFVDPNNPTCAFVVDREAAEEGNIKPTITLSRKGGEKGGSFHDSAVMPTKKGSSFHDRIVPERTKGSSFHGRSSSAKRGNSFHDGGAPPSRKGTSFHDGGASASKKGASFHDSSVPPGRKGTSFHGRTDEKRGDRSHRSHRRNRSSAHVDDDSDHGPSYSVSDRAKSKSFHREPSRPSGKTKSKSFHDHHRRKRSSHLTEDSDHDDSSQSIDILKQAGGGGPRPRSGAQFAKSEPIVGASRRRGVHPEPPP